MKSIVVRCPECNAALKVVGDSAEVTCTYCGTPSLVQRRTGLLQRPAPLPPAPPDGPAVRVAKESGSKGLLLGAIYLLVLLSLTTGLPIVLCLYDARPLPVGPSVLVDVNGDGTPDIVALVRVRESEVNRLAALDGRDGDRLWRTGELRRSTDFGLVCVAGDTVLEGVGATLRGHTLATGEQRFAARFDEVVKKLCASQGGESGEGAGTVTVITANDRAHELSLANGGVRPVSRDARCPPLNCGELDKGLPGYELASSRGKLPGMSIDGEIRHLGTGSTLAFGYKTPGSQLPMVAGTWSGSAPAEGNREASATPPATWQSVAPAKDPLQAADRRLDKRTLALDDKVAVVGYEVKDGTYRATVFELQNGRRRFDVPLPEQMRNIWTVHLTPRLAVFTSSWGVIVALDLQTGAEVFSID